MFSFRFSFQFPSHIFFLSIDNSWAKYTILYTTHQSTPTGSLFSRPSVPCWDDEAIEWKPKVKHKKSENVVLAGLESPRPFYFHFFGIFVLEKPPVKKSWNEFQTRKWFYLLLVWWPALPDVVDTDGRTFHQRAKVVSLEIGRPAPFGGGGIHTDANW